MALDAAALRNNTYCLHEISKNIDGEVLVLDADQKTCPNPSCEPLTLVQYLDLTLRSADCDSNFGTILDGIMRVSNLTTVFTGPSERLRGVHAADFFYWKPFAGGGIGSGTLQGITNAGIVRPPVFRECEECRQVGILTGHLFATGNNVPGIPVPDFNVDAVYRLAWDPIAGVRMSAPVTGTLEGVIIMPCQK
jgi:hypothetical protein